jgi:diguanylate cyclase (GGDEF)-like protein
MSLPAFSSALLIAVALAATMLAATRGGRRERHAAELATCVALGLGLLLDDGADPLALALLAATIVAAAEVVGFRVAALRRIAVTDPLTGLPDRRGLEERAARAIAACQKSGRPLSVVRLDLDDFKAVNDSFGHAAGDWVLCSCAKNWAAMLAADQILARVGGDEFILVLPGCDREEAELLLDSLRFGSPTSWSHGTAQLRDDDDLGRCLLRADAALYLAKDRRAKRRQFGERLSHHQLLRLEERAPEVRWADLN